MMTKEELQSSLDRWHKNHPETLQELEEELKNKKPRGIKSEEEFNQIRNEIKEIRKIANDIAVRYGLKNEKMD